MSAAAPTGAQYTPEVLAELDARVARSLARWQLSPATAVRRMHVSENATYALDDPAGRSLVLRLHRLGYSSLPEIRSELAWIQALRHDGIVDTAAPVPGADGDLVQQLAPVAQGPPRFAVAFERVPGREPEAPDAPRWFERLGEATARLHRHARAWRPPAGFQRKRWDVEAMVGPQGYWGPWRAAIGLDAAQAAVLERGLAHIRTRLAQLGTGPGVFGLVHADLRLANLLVDGEALRIIDFDDCGFSWFGYDFATAVSFIEAAPEVPALLEHWCRGYRREAPLDAALRAELPTFVVLRRVLLTAWLASHAEVPFARQFGARYTEGSAALADALLAGRFLS